MAMRVKNVAAGFYDASGFHAGDEYSQRRPKARRKKKATGRKAKPKAEAHRRRNPYRGHVDAFDAGKTYRTSGAYYKTGVANARVVRYGFLKWFNNQPPSVVGSKGRLEREFREGYAAGKRIEAKSSKRTSQRNPIPVKWATAKVRRLGNDVQVMLFPEGKVAKRRAKRRTTKRRTIRNITRRRRR